MATSWTVKTSFMTKICFSAEGTQTASEFDAWHNYSVQKLNLNK